MATWPFWLKERGTGLRHTKLGGKFRSQASDTVSVMPIRLCLLLFSILVSCANATKICSSSSALFEAYTMPSGAESAGQLQRRSMQFFVQLNLPVAIHTHATTTSPSLTRTSATTSIMESSSPFKTMWADLRKLTPGTSPEQQALQVFLEQRT